MPPPEATTCLGPGADDEEREPAAGQQHPAGPNTTVLLVRHMLVVLDSSGSSSGTAPVAATTIDSQDLQSLDLHEGENWLCWEDQQNSLQVRSDGLRLRDCDGDGGDHVVHKNPNNNNNNNRRSCCYICLDVDGPYATIKDMRTPDETAPVSRIVLLVDNNDASSSHREEQPLRPRQLRVLRHTCQIRVLDHETGAPRFRLLYSCCPESTKPTTTRPTTTTTTTDCSTASPSNATAHRSLQPSLADDEPCSHAGSRTHTPSHQRHRPKQPFALGTPQSVEESEANSVLLTPPPASSSHPRASPSFSSNNHNDNPSTPGSSEPGVPPDDDDDDDDENSNDENDSSSGLQQEAYVETQVAAARVHQHHHSSPVAAETQDEAVPRAARSSVDHAGALDTRGSAHDPHHNNNNKEEEEVLSDLSETKDKRNDDDNDDDNDGDPCSHPTSSDATMSDDEAANASMSEDDSVIVVTSTAGLERSAAFLTQPSSYSNNNNNNDVEDENGETQYYSIPHNDAVRPNERSHGTFTKENRVATKDSHDKPAVQAAKPEMGLLDTDGMPEPLDDTSKVGDNSLHDHKADDNSLLARRPDTSRTVDTTDTATNLSKALGTQLPTESVVVGREETIRTSNGGSTDETRAESEPEVDATGSNDPIIHAAVAAVGATDAAGIENETANEEDDEPPGGVHRDPGNEAMASSPNVSSTGLNTAESAHGRAEVETNIVKNETCESDGNEDNFPNDSVVQDDTGCSESDEPTQPHAPAKLVDAAHIGSGVADAAPNNLPHGVAAQEPLPSSESCGHQEDGATKECSSAMNAATDTTNREAMGYDCVATAHAIVDEKTSASGVTVAESVDTGVTKDSLSNHKDTDMNIDANSPTLDGETLAETAPNKSAAATPREAGKDGTPISQRGNAEAATDGLPADGPTEWPQSCGISENKCVDASSTASEKQLREEAESYGSKTGSSAMKRKQDSRSAPTMPFASSTPADFGTQRAEDDLIDSKSPATKRPKRGMKSRLEDTAAVPSEMADPAVAAAGTPSPSAGPPPLAMQTPIALRPSLGTSGTTATRSTRKRKAAAASDTMASSTRHSASTRKALTPSMSTRGKQTVVEEVRILVTGLDLDTKQKKMVKDLGAVLIDKIADAHTTTHVIAYDDKTPMRRTPKLMIALSCKTKNIVRLQWLIESHAANELLPCEDFLALDKVAEKKYSFSMKKTLSIIGSRIDNDTPRLLEGWSVFVCKGVAGYRAPDAKELRLMVEAAGGSWHSSWTKKGLDFSKLLIITSDPEESKQVSLKAVSGALENGAAKRTTSWLFDTLMKQKLDLV